MSGLSTIAHVAFDKRKLVVYGGGMKIRFKHDLMNGGFVTFTAPVIAMRIKDRAMWVEISPRVRSIPFPPFDGKRFVLIKPGTPTIGQ